MAKNQPNAFDITKFKNNFRAGARQYLFYMIPNIPVPGFNKDQSVYLVRSTTLPEVTLEETLVNWQGYDFKMASKYTFADWTVSFNVDQKAKIHEWFTKWTDMIHDPETNVHGDPVDYMTDQRVQLLGLDGKPIVEYILIDAWPGAVGALTLDYATTDVAQFDVTFKYQRHIIEYK